MSPQSKMNKEELHYLTEYLKTLKNQAEISLLIIEKNRLDLLPTELECAYETAQILIDNYCIKE